MVTSALAPSGFEHAAWIASWSSRSIPAWPRAWNEACICALTSAAPGSAASVHGIIPDSSKDSIASFIVASFIA